MSLHSDPELLALKQELIDTMTDYMKFGGAEDEDDPDFDPDFDAGYTQADIDRCAEILDTLLEALTTASEAYASSPAHDDEDEADGEETELRDESIMQAVKEAVLDLNALNEACEGGLIETDQREQLCDLIITAATQAGLDTDGQDITEEWREW
jgi:hypothetical protein